MGGVVAFRFHGGLDAIDEHSRNLVDALRVEGEDVTYVSDGLDSAPRDAAWVLLQYNPFRYGRAGFAPRLLAQASALRVPLVVMVHEAFIDREDPRSTLIGTYQRVQLAALLRIADARLASTEPVAARLRAEHHPVASNVAPLPVTRTVARARLGVRDTLVVALLGRRHPSRALAHAEAAVAALATEHELTVLNLGADAPALAVDARIDVRQPGPLSAGNLSHMLRAADLVLLPLVDGVSTRRTTLMAALAHGLPVLGLHGASTDRLLLEHPEAMVLTPARDQPAFSRAALALAADRARREAVGRAGRALYDARFGWPLAASRVVRVLDRVAPERERRTRA